MADLNIRITNRTVKGVNRTCTRIGKKHGIDKIVFHNESTNNAELRVDFDPVNVVKNKAGTTDLAFIKVPPNDKVVVTLDGAVGTEVKYTATITGAAPEDPIIIID